MTARSGASLLHRLASLALATQLLGVTFGARAQDEVPFVVTPDAVTQALLELADVRPGEFLIDLGSGDGRIVIAAASRFGASGLGVDLDAGLVALSQTKARAAGVAQQTEFRVQNLFDTELQRAQVITLYLLPAVNMQLRSRLLALAPGTRIVSHDWDMGEWQPDRSLTMDVPDKPVGQDQRSTLHLWVVPLQVHGRWCAAGAALDITQRFQTFSATLSETGLSVPGLPAPVVEFDGRVTATGLQSSPNPRGAEVLLQQRSDGPDTGLQLLRASGPAARFEGRLFKPAGPQGCG